MPSANKPRLLALLGGLALVSAIPALGQDAPKSILPPGFGEPDKPVAEEDQPNTPKPADVVPDVRLNTPGSTLAAGNAINVAADAENPEGDEELPTGIASMQDLPPSARRSTAQVGILEPGDGDMGAAAFGAARGPYLTYLMRHLRGPIASRWSEILLRRALLSKAHTPAGVSGPDWVAERAWLLIRLGEADAARMLVQSVDTDQYTPKLFQVAMQASLASADPSGMCAYAEAGAAQSKEPVWPFARAICSALAGDSAVASAQVDAAERGRGRQIDGLLAEKVVGAGGNTRRAVVIEWDSVSQLTAWRYGMATATALDIPDRLMKTVGPHVRAWRARAPLLPIDQRIADADIAAALGVLSSAALVDQYGAWADGTDPADYGTKPFTLLRSAYVGDDDTAKLAAMRGLWTAQGLDFRVQYARSILTARAAGMIVPNEDLIGDAGSLIASMLSAGLDIQAARWAKLVEDGSGESASRGWGLLAVGAPGQVVSWGIGNIRDYQGNVKDGPRGAFLFAAMSGLGRMNESDASSMAESLKVPVGRQTAWTRALERAVAMREPGTVALLCAVGLQNPQWKTIPPVQLYHITSALRRVGLVGEARMIAAEALARA